MVRRSIGLEYRYLFLTLLATYHPMQFRHPNILLDFGAHNPGIPQRACHRLLGGRHLRGLPCTLGERRLQPQRGGMEEVWTGWTRYLTGVSAARMTGCRAAARRHCLGGFRLGWYRHQQDPEFWAHWCGRRAPLVGRWRWYLPLRSCESFPVWLCVRWCLACWPISRVSFDRLDIF